MGVAALLTPAPGGPEATSIHKSAGRNDWVDRDCDDDDDDDSRHGGESRPTTPTPIPAHSGDGAKTAGSPDPALDIDQQISAYEMEKRLEEISKLIKKEASAIRSACERVVIDESVRPRKKYEHRPPPPPTSPLERMWH